MQLATLATLLSLQAAAAAGTQQLCGGACSDGMVLDRLNATLWIVGAAPGAKFTATVKKGAAQVGAPVSSRAGADGLWVASLGAQAPGVGYSVAVTATDGSPVATLSDVAFGDVLLCSGQSNMEYGLASIVGAKAILAEANTLGAGVRILRVDHLSSPNSTVDTLSWDHDWAGNKVPCKDRCGGPWSRMSSANASFSAVCYLTGKNVYQALQQKVPIGLVEAAWGGTRIEAWQSPASLATCPGTGTAKCGPCLGKGRQRQGLGQACARMNSSNSGNLCSCNYNGMLRPIRKMKFKSMLWYQGESNTDSFQGTLPGPANYACRMKAAVQDWRNLLGDAALPFFNVELAACNNYPNAADNAKTWAYIRQASRSFMALPGINGFITMIDGGIHGGAVHSNEKQPDGLRMSRQLLQKVYGQNDVNGADGPTLLAAPAKSSGHLVLSFRGAAALHTAPTSAFDTVGSKLGCKESPFEVGYSDGTWLRAAPVIAGTKVTLALAPAPKQPTEVRYVWQGFPQCALYSGTSGNFSSATAMPAAPFRVALGACATTQKVCSLGQGVSIGAYVASQCCAAHEVCVPSGGCQDPTGQ